MEAKRDATGCLPLWAFAINWLVGFGEYGVPYRWLDRLSRQDGEYPLVVESALLLLGLVIAATFFCWLAIRFAIFVVTFRWVACLPDH